MNMLFRPYNKQFGQRGVTFVELLITIGLLSVLLMILLTIFTSSIDVQARSQGYAATSSDGRLILTRLEYDVKRATSINTPAGLGDTSSSLALTIDGHAYTYSVSGGKLQLDVDGGSTDLTGAEATISNLSFQKLGNIGGKASVRYSFTVTANSQSAHEPDTQTFTSTTEQRL